MKKILSTKAISEIAIFSALGFTLDMIQGPIFNGLFPNGGSIGIAMIPILVMCYRRGFVCGLLTGLIMGLLQMLGGIYVFPNNTFVTAFIQVALDYWLAYPLVGFAGLFFAKYHKDSKVSWIIVGTIVGGSLKYLCHFLSGVLFWPSDLWNVGSSTLFSVLYNGAYMVPSIILCALLMYLLGKKQRHIFNCENIK